MPLIAYRFGHINQIFGTQDIKFEKSPTYAACVTNLSIAATPTDVFSISGGINKIIKIRFVQVSGTATSLTHSNIVLVKRITANSGTSSPVTIVAMDSQNPSPVASIVSYTANPTLGTSAGNIMSFEYAYAAAATQTSDIRTFTFGEQSDQLITLRGVR
jgi:hypothetical protein